MKALVLAGGFPQITLIKELKKRNIIVILADYNEEPVAKKYADVFYRESTLDVDAIINIAKKEKVDFLITVCTDQALLTVAYVSEKLGLPCYIDYKTALNVTNKSYMKDIFINNNIPTAKYIILDKYDEDKIINFKFPLIVKPVDCNSSKGVKKVNSLDELKYALDIAVNFSRTKTAIIEEFIAGPELSVDIYVENGKANVLCISNNDKIKDNEKFIIFRGVCPAREYNNIKDKVQIVAQQIVDAFNLSNTPMLIQMIVNENNVYVLEFSARTGGGTKFLRINRMTGFDVINAVIDLTLGKFPKVDLQVNNKMYLIDEFIYCKPGIYNHLEGFDELINTKILTDYYIFKWKGAEFNSISSSGDRIAGYTIQSDSLEELEKKHRIVRDSIKVMDKDGNDIMRHDLITDINYNLK